MAARRASYRFEPLGCKCAGPALMWNDSDRLGQSAGDITP
jgi:hypothetical protein